MYPFRRNSKSPSKSSESPPKSSAPPEPPKPDLWQQQEEDLFKQIQNHLKNGENVPGTGGTGNFINVEKFGSDVDSADEAYKTPCKPGDENSIIPSPAEPSDGETTAPQESEPEPVESPTREKPDDDQPLDAGRDTNERDAAGKKEEDIDDYTPPMLVDIIISCTTFTIAVILVTYYFIKDIVPAKFSNFRKRWGDFTASFIISPAFISKLYDEVFEPMKIQSKLHGIFKNPFAKPAAVKTTLPGNDQISNIK